MENLFKSNKNPQKQVNKHVIKHVTLNNKPANISINSLPLPLDCLCEFLPCSNALMSSTAKSWPGFTYLIGK